MGQTRFNTYGNLIESEDLATVVSSLFSPGRLVGNEFQVAGQDLLRISPGSCLLPDGVLIVEDEYRDLVVSNSSMPSDYTVIYQLEDSRVIGGSPAILRLISGISRQEDYKDAVILGWINYPGGSIPISDSHFVQPFPRRIKAETSDFYYFSSSPFNAIKPETPGAKSLLTVSMPIPAVNPDPNNADLGKKVISFGGIQTKIHDLSLTTHANISGTQNYIVINVKKGAKTLFSFDTRDTSISSGSVVKLVKNLTLTGTDFIALQTESVSIEVVTTGLVSVRDLNFSFVLETPPSSGSWSETTRILNNEIVTTFKNESSQQQVLNFDLPFVIPVSGQPRKLVSRLSVDFNCIVTLSLHVEGHTIIITPNSGIVSNTGSLITREFDIPIDTSVSWTPGTTATININIDSQPGRSASFSNFALSLEPSPVNVFV